MQKRRFILSPWASGMALNFDADVRPTCEIMLRLVNKDSFDLYQVVCDNNFCSSIYSVDILLFSVGAYAT